jgi:hypothetical protein
MATVCWLLLVEWNENEGKGEGIREEGKKQAMPIITSRAADRTKDTRATNFDLKEPIH